MTKTEVETFCITGYFEDATNFGTKKFTYALQAKEGINNLAVEFQGNTITLYLNKQKSKDWFQSNQVGFSHSAKKENGTKLSFLLEEDFACFNENTKYQSDNYSNPLIKKTMI